MSLNVFSFQDYKKYLNAVVKANKKNWGFISKMAERSGCQRSYLSRVLNAEVHLTPDHAFHLSGFLGHSDSEAEYFSLLVEHQRASTSQYKQKIFSKMKSIIADQEDLQKLVKRPSVNLGEKEAIYYSQWIYSAIHILVSIPKFQTVSAICEKLQLDKFLVESALHQLRDMGLVKSERSRWVYASSELHVPKNSPLVVWHHNNWRGRAILSAQKQMMGAHSGQVHFSVVQSVDKKAIEQIRAKVLSCIEEFSRIAGPAESEELVAFTCDFFVVD